MSDGGRARRLADRIKVVVAQTLEHRVKDPRLGFITITDARVTGDLQHATVFYTVFGDDEEKAATAVALESAKGKLRSEVGRATGVRLTPTLEFIADAVPENAASIEHLLARAQEHDAQVAALAVGKQFAGDADPYKHEPEFEDDDEFDDDLDEADDLDDEADDLDGDVLDDYEDDSADEDESDEDDSDEDDSEDERDSADGDDFVEAREPGPAGRNGGSLG